MYKTWNEYRDLAYAAAQKKGWHDEPLSNDHMKCLIVTEMSEVVQADRLGNRARLKEFEQKVGCYNPNCIPHMFKRYIKDTVEDELADVAIRCFDFAGANNIDLSEYPNCGYMIKPDKSLTENIYAIMREFMNPALHIEEQVRITLNLVFKLAENMGIELHSFIEMKMEYNKFRGYKNGKKY